MAVEINKGTGKRVEFYGLQAQYLVIAAIGLVLLLVFILIVNALGAPGFVSFGIGLMVVLIGGSYLIQTSKKHGAYGLMHLHSRSRTPIVFVAYKAVRTQLS
jgi:hypothetical protein